jgi:hypothetical protein
MAARLAQSVLSTGTANNLPGHTRKTCLIIPSVPVLAFCSNRRGDCRIDHAGIGLHLHRWPKVRLRVRLALGIVPLGRSFMTAGIVNLKTGDLQWMNFDSSSTLDSRDPNDLDDQMRERFESYRGPR